VNRTDSTGYLSWKNIAKIAIGAAAIAIGVAATVATGGAAAPALIAALQVAGGSAAVGAIVGGITGGWEGAVNGACEGFMWGGIGAGASMVGKAIQAAKIGTSFGKLGTLVKYKKININWGKTTSHMLQRMSERGMSKSTIEWVIKNGKRLQQGIDKFIYITKKRAVVIDNTGTLITGYGSNYYDDVMKSVVKQLFGG
jgi:hypothetical protein